MAKAVTTVSTPETTDKVVINHMPIRIMSIDRTMKDIKNWWDALQQAESVYFPRRADLYDILATVELDGHLTGIIEKRIMNTTNKVLYFRSGETKIDALDALTKTAEFKRLRQERFQQITHGLVGWEFVPGKDFAFNTIPVKHINPVTRRITKEQWGDEGFVFEGIWNIIVLGQRFDFGLLNKCAPYAIWKKGNMADWAQYIEVFGQPFVIFSYDAHDETAKKKLDDAMRSIGSGTRMQLPKQVEFKIEDGKNGTGSNGDLQEQFRLACNQEMSIIILGVDGTSTSSEGSGYAQSKEHGEQQDEVTKDDMDDELKFFNSPQWLAIQKSYGYPAEGEWCYEDEVDLKEVKAKLDIAMTVRKSQPVDDNYVYELTSIPKPANYDQLKTQMEEERKASMNPPPGAKGNAKKEDPKNQRLSAWRNMRQSLADFFDPAPKE